MMFISFNLWGQKIKNPEKIQDFFKKFDQSPENNQIVLLGDSHIQAGWLSEFLRTTLQKDYGNAGRGLVFPYSIANSNNPDDFTAITNTTWENFRLVHQQNTFPQIGLSGFIISNNQASSYIEMTFKNENDAFDEVRVFHDAVMKGQSYTTYQNPESLKNYTQLSKANEVYTTTEESLPELASRFYTTTAKIKQLNGGNLTNVAKNMKLWIEKTQIIYDARFEKLNKKLSSGFFDSPVTTIQIPLLSHRFLIELPKAETHRFYGFQFLNTQSKGLVLNTIGINGASFSDFTRYPLQLQQLAFLKPNFVIIALGTNESVSTITKAEFLNNAKKLIRSLKQNLTTDPALLIVSPTDNLKNPKKIKEIVEWLKEFADSEKISFLNLYELTGGEHYFQNSLKKKQANKDGIHFLKEAYEKQAELIYRAIKSCLKNT